MGNQAAPVRSQRQDGLPPSLAPIGVRRVAAATYIGVSPSKFDEMVADGRMPKPTHVDGCVIWDVELLYSAFKALADENGDNADAPKNEWDDLCSSTSKTGPAV